MLSVPKPSLPPPRTTLPYSPASRSSLFVSCGSDDSCTDADLKKFRHTFLMRDPRKSIPSFYRVTLGECGIFGEFDPNEAGFAELQALMVIRLE